MTWFRAFLEQALADVHLSRKERQVLGELLDEHRPDADRLAQHRSELFDVVEQRVGVAAGEAARLRFCEDVLRAFQRYSGDQREHTVHSEALFFPSDRAHRRLLDVLGSTREQLDICVFTITDDRLVAKLEAAVKRGCRVRVISDDDKSEDRGSDVERLERLGALVRLDHDPEHMHHKFALIDRTRLLTGSFNWTRSAANRNRENVLITDDRHAVAAYQQEFDQLWNLFRRP